MGVWVWVWKVGRAKNLPTHLILCDEKNRDKIREKIKLEKISSTRYYKT